MYCDASYSHKLVLGWDLQTTKGSTKSDVSDHCLKSWSEEYFSLTSSATYNTKVVEVEIKTNSFAPVKLIPLVIGISMRVI